MWIFLLTRFESVEGHGGDPVGERVAHIVIRAPTETLVTADSSAKRNAAQSEYELLILNT